jgi:CheY-like chemotaxis protein
MTRTGSFATESHGGAETGDLIYKRIRDTSKSIPIFIMTAKTKQGLKEQYFSDKNTQVFLKPIDSVMITKLLSLLKAL